MVLCAHSGILRTVVRLMNRKAGGTNNQSHLLQGGPMKIASILRTTIVAAGLCAACTTASANTYTISFVQSATTPTVWTGGYFDPSVSGNFSDIFRFSNPATTAPAAQGATNAFSLGIMGTNVIFDLFQLVDASTNVVLANGATGGTASFMNFTLPNAVDGYELQVNGHTDPLASTGSYAGNIAVSAVPEPQNYAMLLTGLALIGITALRKKHNRMAFA